MIDSWPEGLPQRFISDSFSTAMADNRLRSEVDVGPAKMRRRSSRAARPMSGSMLMTTSQLNDVLRPFVETDLGQGILPFMFPDPAGGDPILCRFAADGLPSWTHERPGFWRVSVKFEVLP